MKGSRSQRVKNPVSADRAENGATRLYVGRRSHPAFDEEGPEADKDDDRFQLAAARWHAQFVLDAKLPLRDAEGVMTLLCRIRGADRHVVRRRLLLSVERVGLTAREINRRG